MGIIYEYYSFKIKVSSCSCVHGLVKFGIYVYCHATIGSPAHFVPMLQSMKTPPLVHLISLVCPPGC